MSQDVVPSPTTADSGAAPAAAQDTLRVTVRVRRNPANQARWERAVAQASDGDLGARRFLDAGQLRSLDSASFHERQRVTQFAADHGLAVLPADPLSRDVVLEGSHAAVQAAFPGTEIHHIDALGSTRHSHIGEMPIPEALGGVVEGVLLRDTPRAFTKFMVAPPGAQIAGRTARQYADFYNALDSNGQPLPGAGRTIAIISFGGGYDPANFQSACTEMGVPVPAVEVVSVDGATLQYTGDPSSADVENHLDLAAIAGAAPGCTIKFFIAPNTNRGMTDVIDAIAKDAVVDVASMSWGDQYPNYTAAERTSVHDALQRLTVAGIPLINSAGDNGDREKGAQPIPDYPTSDTLVTSAVGVDEPGTHLDTTIWNDLASGGGATGAGDNPDQPKPAWQQNIPPAQGGDSGTQREYGDIAAIAAPAHGCRFPFAGSDITVGGTSLSAPLIAGFTALLTTANGGRRLGPLNPIAYQWLGTAAVNDVVRGGTEDFTAVVGYDRPSGIGTLNVAEAARWVAAHAASGPAAAALT